MQLCPPFCFFTEETGHWMIAGISHVPDPTATSFRPALSTSKVVDHPFSYFFSQVAKAYYLHKTRTNDLINSYFFLEHTAHVD